MKNKTVLTTFLSILLAALSISAQTKATDFSGDWTLDVNKSKFSNGMQIESMTLKVSQTEKELKVENMTKRSQTNDMRGGGGGGRRGGNGGAIINNYTLDGKETSSDVGNGTMNGKETRKATVTSDGKLSLTSTRSFNDGTGELVIKTNETWELADAGATLKVTRYMETPRGATNSEMYFTKNASDGAIKTIEAPVMIGSEPVSKQINGGVLNGKAISFPKPAYPAAARAVRASGAVNVQVTVDEQGNIISASALSGHPLLRAAAEDAARSAKFAPTLLQGVPVKVTGVIVYNFVP